jgi:nucleoside-diphosphate-sugar epimerase
MTEARADERPGVLLSLGHGYSAQALAGRLLPLGWQVIGTARRPEALDDLAAQGVTPQLWPGEPLGPALVRATHLLTSVPPRPDSGDPVLAAEGDGIAAARHLRWVGYLSTTGVYGDRGGDWVDETAPPAPASERAAARLAAEQAWTRLCAEAGLPLAIFRLAGIYGPGRSPFDRLRAGTAQAVVKEGQVFSRIHVDDIAAVLAASMARPPQGVAIYNVADDAPAPPQDVIWHAADLIGLPRPPAVPYQTADLSPMARSFYADSKRVRNDRIKRELGVTLAHPDYRAGLAAILTAETGG